MNIPVNLFCGRIAVSCVRSLLAYQRGMSRRSLCDSLRFIPQNQIFKDVHHG